MAANKTPLQTAKELQITGRIPAGEPPLASVARVLIGPDNEASLVAGQDGSLQDMDGVEVARDMMPENTTYPELMLSHVGDVATARPINAGRTMNAIAKLRAGTAPLRVLSFGDSVVFGTIEPICTQMAQRVGHAGFGSFWASSIGPYDTLSSASIVTDTTKWFSGIYRMASTGQGYTVRADGAIAYLTGDTIQIIYRTQAGGGSFKVQTDPGTGTFADESGYTAVSTAGTEGSASITISKTYGRYKVRLLWVSGTADVLTVGVYRSSGPGIIMSVVARAGSSMSEWTALPAATRQGYLAALAPDVIFLRWYEAAILPDVQTLLADLEAVSLGGLVDIVILGVSQVNPQDDVQVRQVFERQQAAALCGAQLIELFDGFNTRFMSDVTHPDADGYAWAANRALHELGWLTLPACLKPSPLIAKRTSLAVIADSTTFADDAVLFLYLAPGVHLIRFALHSGSAAVGPGFKALLQFVGENSNSYSGYVDRAETGTSPTRTMILLTGGSVATFPVFLVSGNTAVTNSATSGEMMFEALGPGRLSIQIAREATGGTAYIREGSYLQAIPLP